MSAVVVLAAPSWLGFGLASRRILPSPQRWCQRIFSLICTAITLTLAGIKKRVNPHAFRHSAATHMLENGADIVTIGECLGHASLSNTQKYTHLAMVDIIDAYNIAHPRA
jgi:site-specific recombinase XerD